MTVENPLRHCTLGFISERLCACNYAIFPCWHPVFLAKTWPSGSWGSQRALRCSRRERWPGPESKDYGRASARNRWRKAHAHQPKKASLLAVLLVTGAGPQTLRNIYKYTILSSFLFLWFLFFYFLISFSVTSCLLLSFLKS